MVAIVVIDYFTIYSKQQPLKQEMALEIESTASMFYFLSALLIGQR